MPPVAEDQRRLCPLEQPNPTRQYTLAVRWLTLRDQRLRDQARDIKHYALPSVGDRAQGQDQREQCQRDQVAGLDPINQPRTRN